MRILMISAYHYSAYKAGQEKHFNDFALHLSVNHEIIYCSSSTIPHDIQLPYRHVTIPLWIKWPYPFPNVWRLINLVVHEKTDVIHLGSSLPTYAIVAWFLQFLQKPVVGTLLASHKANDWLRTFTGTISDIIFGLTYRVVTANPNQYPWGYTWLHQKVFITPPIFQGFTVQPKSQKKSFALFIGRLDQDHHYKGLDWILRHELVDHFKLTVIGGGNKLEWYKHHYSDLDVTWLGEVDEATKNKMLSTATVLLLPSTSAAEGFGITVVEAIKRGTRTITTDCAGVSSFLSFHPMISVIPSENIPALQLALQKAFQTQSSTSVNRLPSSLTSAEILPELERAYQQALI